MTIEVLNRQEIEAVAGGLSLAVGDNPALNLSMSLSPSGLLSLVGGVAGGVLGLVGGLLTGVKGLVGVQGLLGGKLAGLGL